MHARPISIDPGPHEWGADALECMRPHLDAVGDDLMARNVGVADAVVIALTTHAKVESMRDQLATVGGGFQIAHYDRLPLAARALEYIDRLLRRQRMAPKLDYERGLLLRKQLFASATSLAHGGLIEPEDLKHLNQGSGTAEIAQCLLDLVSKFRDAWDEIRDNTWVTQDMLGEAVSLARTLQLTVEMKSRGTLHADLSRLRERAFTVLARWYDQVRRAVAFLRWTEGDADVLAPSLFRKRRKRKAKNGEAPAAPAAPTEGANTTESRKTELAASSEPVEGTFDQSRSRRTTDRQPRGSAGPAPPEVS